MGGGLLSAAVAVASCVGALAGGPAPAHRASHHPADPIRAEADAASMPDPPRVGATKATGALGAPGAPGVPDPATAPDLTGAVAPRLVVPDVIAAVPGGATQADLAKIRKLSQVRDVLPIAGARITVNGKPLTVLSAPASALRPWTPPETAASRAVWSGFAAGDLITTASAARELRLVSGREYPVAAAVRATVPFGTKALLGIAGVDAIVNPSRARQLGLVPNVAVLINAPAADMTALVARLKTTLGEKSKVVRLVPVTVSTSLPVDRNPPKGKPTSYLALFQESAAQYCPGLSWAVLAAIGQIESGDGANVGPSKAGALGPMQFLASTWKIWGISGFGDTGPPDVMNPFDAVPSAARMLCADGAAAGGQALRQAIFDYNHATWYVDEVLTLAGEYAREFG